MRPTEEKDLGECGGDDAELLGGGFLGLGGRSCVHPVAPRSSMELLQEQPLGWFYMDFEMAKCHCPALFPALSSGGKYGAEPGELGAAGNLAGCFVAADFRKEKDVVAQLKPLENSVVRFPSLRVPGDGACSSGPLDP